MTKTAPTLLAASARVSLNAPAATHRHRASHAASAAAASAAPEAASKTGPDGVPITHAASVLVIDARTGQVLYQKNADERRPPASTQKLLTSLIVAEAGI